MKRKIVLASAILVVSALTAFFLLRRDSNSARFIPASANFKVPPYADVQYPFVLSSPFENGLVWLNTWNNTPGSAKSYLYDLEQRKVLGEIVNGWPVLGNRDQSKVLLMANSTSLREDLFRFFDKLTRGKLNLASRNVEESFAIFDRERNQSKYVGRLYQYQGASSRWYPSPDYRFAYTSPSVSHDEITICDFHEMTLKKKSLVGYTTGWWDNTQILYRSEQHDLALYDVITRKSKILVRAADIEAFFQQNQIQENVSDQRIAPIHHWQNGEYQFYLTDTYEHWAAQKSFLAKIEKPSGKLKLIATDYQFEWSDSFDESGRYYLFSGLDFSGSNKPSAVYIRDLQTGLTRTLVPDSGQKRHTIPRWFGTNIIYWQSNAIWQIGLSDTNPIRVFPPME